MVDHSEQYTTEVFWSEEDEGFVATAPDLPGCSAFGETRAEAIAEIGDAIASWIEAAITAGNPVPQPSERKTFEDYSGKYSLRMPKQLHFELVEAAANQSVSLNSYINYELSKAVRVASPQPRFLVTLSSSRHLSSLNTFECMDFPAKAIDTSPKAQGNYDTTSSEKSMWTKHPTEILEKANA